MDIASDGVEATDKFDINSYDLVVLDIMLPRKDGLTVCREIRAKNTNIPIMLLTARGSVADRVLGLNSGADDYLVKPFAFDELIARLKALLRRSPQAIPTTLQVGDLVLNTTSRQVIRGGTTVRLTAREYGLLDYLVRHTGIALSKSQILDHVWDYNYEGLSNVVETYIKYLRKKLRVAPDSPELIHTVRGHGYVLKELTDV